MPSAKILEVACFNPGSALIAQKAGADRIELCENYDNGGITPSNDLISETRKNLNIPIHVIIRARGGNFIYSEQEINEMKNAVLFCRSQNINGIVFGALNTNNTIDISLCSDFIQLAKPMSVTFHRAIDQCENLDAAMEQLIALGVNRVLTSGGAGNAADNIERLTQLQNKYGSQVIIMPGGGLRSANIEQVMQCGCNEYHSAAITDNTVIADANEIQQLKHFLE